METSSDDVSATVRAYKDAEASLWRRYALWVEDPETQITIVQRASRACPQVGAMWALCLQHLVGTPLHHGLTNEESSEDQFIPAFDRALSLGLLDQPKDIADIYICRAARDIRCDPEQGTPRLA